MYSSSFIVTLVQNLIILNMFIACISRKFVWCDEVCYFCCWWYYSLHLLSYRNIKNTARKWNFLLTQKEFKQRKWVLATNSNIFLSLSSIYMVTYSIKSNILCMKYQRFTDLVVKYSSLWQKLSFFLLEDWK